MRSELSLWAAPEAARSGSEFRRRPTYLVMSAQEWPVGTASSGIGWHLVEHDVWVKDDGPAEATITRSMSRSQ